MPWHQPISVTAKIGHFFNIKNQEPTTPERTKHSRQKICGKHQGKIYACAPSQMYLSLSLAPQPSRPLQTTSTHKEKNKQSWYSYSYLIQSEILFAQNKKENYKSRNQEEQCQIIWSKILPWFTWKEILDIIHLNPLTPRSNL